jgi:prepilin-type N-terminal cleavage/methylation domain-containing protein
MSRLARARRLLESTDGMTLPEVIAALSVITIGLLGLMAAMPLSTSQIAEANRKTTGVFLAQQRLEQVKNSRWTSTPAVDTLGGGGSDGAAAVGQWPDEAAVAGYPAFQRQVRIRDCSVAPGCGIAVAAVLASLRQVTVTVRFARMTGAGMSETSALEMVQLVTYVSRQN